MGVKAVIFKEEMSKYIFNMSAGAFWRVVFLGASAGLFTWLLALALDKYMLTPIFCADASGASICANSTVVAANVAAVLVGVMTVPLLAVIHIKRALLVVIMAVAALWGVAAWTSGSWLASLLWTVGSYAAVYLAISWINRLRGDLAAIIFIIIFVVLARIVLAL